MVYELSDICAGITDGSHNPPIGGDKSTFLMLSSKNVFDNKITFEEPRYLTEKQFAVEHRRTNIKPGDVLMTIVGTVGRTAVVTENTPAITLQRSVAVLHPREDICNSHYLMYLLRSKRSYFETEAHGVAQKGIYLKQLSDVQVDVPNIKIQQKTVQILDNVQRIIHERQNEISILDDLIKARFVELFGDCRLNPKGWDTVALGDMAEVGSSKRVFVEELKETGIPFYRGTEVGAFAEGKSVTPELFITEDHYRELIKATGKPKPGDLLMPSICPDGRIWVVDTDKPFYFKDGRVLWIHEIDKRFDPVFLLYTLKDRIMTDYGSIASGTTFAELKIFALKQCQVFDVPIEDQKRFAAFIAQVDKSKVAVQASLNKAQQLFDSLMQEYFG